MASIALRGDLTLESGWRLYVAIRDAQDRHITLEIDSLGGDYLLGLRAYNELRRHRGGSLARIVRAESTAVLVAMGAERIEIAPEGSMMIHRPYGDAHTRHDLTYLTDQLAGVYAARTGRAKPAVEKWLAQERRFNATEALRLGFVDAIG